MISIRKGVLPTGRCATTLGNRQLTVQESRHRLAQVICHGKRGQIQQTQSARLAMMSGMSIFGPMVDTRPLFPREREELLELLGSLHP
ncbi:MAG: hypothetical protein ACRDSH_20810, partial [Pseudonocardiaceae bacterium]